MKAPSTTFMQIAGLGHILVLIFRSGGIKPLVLVKPQTVQNNVQNVMEICHLCLFDVLI